MQRHPRAASLGLLQPQRCHRSSPCMGSRVNQRYGTRCSSRPRGTPLICPGMGLLPAQPRSTGTMRFEPWLHQRPQFGLDIRWGPDWQWPPPSIARRCSPRWFSSAATLDSWTPQHASNDMHGNNSGPHDSATMACPRSWMHGRLNHSSPPKPGSTPPCKPPKPPGDTITTPSTWPRHLFDSGSLINPIAAQHWLASTARCWSWLVNTTPSTKPLVANSPASALTSHSQRSPRAVTTRSSSNPRRLNGP